jgi:hypothetical protein
VYVKQIKSQLQNKHNHITDDTQVKPSSANNNIYPETVAQQPLSLFSALFKPFLLTLAIGSMELNLRLYECGSFALSY